MLNNLENGKGLLAIPIGMSCVQPWSPDLLQLLLLPVCVDTQQLLTAGKTVPIDCMQITNMDLDVLIDEFT